MTVVDSIILTGNIYLRNSLSVAGTGLDWDGISTAAAWPLTPTPSPIHTSALEYRRRGGSENLLIHNLLNLHHSFHRRPLFLFSSSTSISIPTSDRYPPHLLFTHARWDCLRILRLLIAYESSLLLVVYERRTLRHAVCFTPVATNPTTAINSKTTLPSLFSNRIRPFCHCRIGPNITINAIIFDVGKPFTGFT